MTGRTGNIEQGTRNIEQGTDLHFDIRHSLTFVQQCKHPEKLVNGAYHLFLTHTNSANPKRSQKIFPCNFFPLPHLPKMRKALLLNTPVHAWDRL